MVHHKILALSDMRETRNQRGYGLTVFTRLMFEVLHIGGKNLEAGGLLRALVPGTDIVRGCMLEGLIK